MSRSGRGKNRFAYLTCIMVQYKLQKTDRLVQRGFYLYYVSKFCIFRIQRG